MPAVRELIELRPEGLYCPAGDFYVDPWRATSTALITHAHADHARTGAARYFAAAPGLAILHQRIGADAAIHGLRYGESMQLGSAQISLHSAGHILGSAQVRIEVDGQVCVVSGDYKRDPDPSCAPFEVVPCDMFVTEATFGLPVYRWPSMRSTITSMLDWWDEAARRKVPAVLFCYALGKAQRVLAELYQRVPERMVYLHGAMVGLTQAYRDAGVAMVATQAVSLDARSKDFAGELILAPPSASGATWMRRFTSASTGFASGWMQIRGNRRRRGYDRGFVISDHADWPGLIDTVRQTGAKRVYATHGNTEALVAFLGENGTEAHTLRTEHGNEE